MSRALALLDSNVVVASIAAEHEHHRPSAALFNTCPPLSFAIAAHSYSEAFSQLTRKTQQTKFGFEPKDAMAALESVAAQSMLVGLTHGQTFDAIRDYAASGGIGPRLYDKLIGEVAVANAVDTIVTWNISHMTGLFPALQVMAPQQFLDARANKPAIGSKSSKRS